MHRRIRRRLALTLAALLTAPLAAVVGVAAAAENPAPSQVQAGPAPAPPKPIPAGPPKSAVQPKAAAAAAPVTSPVVTAVSRGTDKLDVFGVDAGRRIYSAAWEPGYAGWERSTQINGGLAAAGTSVYGISRYAGKMDIFAVGGDHRVWTTTRDDPSALWANWWTIGDLTVAPNTSVHAVTTNSDRIDLFAVGKDRKAYTITWQPQTGWPAKWTKLDGITVASGTMVFGVANARFTGTLDIFAVQVLGGVFFARPYHNSYTPTGGWTGWKEIPAPGLAATSSIYPVSRHWGEISVFMVGYTGEVVFDSWSSIEGWVGYYTIGDGKALGGTTVFGTSRKTDTIDVVATRSDGAYHASMTWDRRWSAWTKIGDHLAAGTSVFVHSRSTDLLDVFAVGANTGSYTAAWGPSSGWLGWWGLGPNGQAGQSLEVSTDINFGGGVTVNGWAHLRVAAGGAYVFEGNMHNYGTLNFDVHFAWMIVLPSGKSLCFATDGKVTGSLGSGGSADHSWFVSSVNTDVQQNWPEIESDSVWHWKRSANVNAVDLASQIVTVVGIFGYIIVVFG
jgi:hypothetical protein